MDYKYIEQLLERYFECETSLGEEQVLRAFFTQENVPVRLLPYRELFAEQARAQQEDTLTAEFDQRILSMLEQDTKKPVRVKARIVSLQRRLRPLYKAAACVAVALAIGQAAQMPYDEERARQDNIARSMEELPIQQDLNAVAKSDSAATATQAQPAAMAN